ncbi:hypothetical protein HOB10_00810 [Candidatus Parcubacteria bacterium]|jgi:hypothetical protein|nr:hypothetical protein [Candidatus Parcubacteria bacterium]
MISYLYLSQDFKKANHVENLLESNNISFYKDANQEFLKNEIFKEVDAYIICLNSLNVKSIYFLNKALSQRKKVLLLLPENEDNNKYLNDLQKDSKHHKFLFTRFYNVSNLSLKLFEFIEILKKNKKSIKYTFRVSQKLKDYLQWKAKKSDMSIADWLRDIMNKDIENDMVYKKRKK